MRISRGVYAASAFVVLIGVWTAAPVSTAAPKFYDDDPVGVERDHQQVSKDLPGLNIDLGVDIALNLFQRLGDPALDVRARNVNSVDEVPDSSWFTNRVGRQPITAEAITRGPDTSPGPATGRWTVTSSKSDGITPGFTVRDGAGQRWFLKFDPPGYRGMATGTEVLVTKLLWALGYFVPENHIAFLRPDELAIDERARFTPPGGQARQMRPTDIAMLLKRADRERDGTYRVHASRGLPKVGEFRFYDTRPDDPNDIVAHEHRRELRGLGVFAAWLNHVDVKGGNTLDALITEDGRTFVRHYLQDFGSTLGSGGVAPTDYWEGNEYLVEPREALKQMVSFGFRLPQWRRMPFYEANSIGRLPRDNARFNPELWKPRVPNQAFLRARADDKFWAARKLMALTDELLRAAVRTGQFNDPMSEEFLVKALRERRDAIGRAYLPAVNPVVDPVLEGGELAFRNAAVDAGVAPPPTAYRAAWFAFDNQSQATRALGETSAAAPRLQVPPGVLSGSDVYIKVQLGATGAPRPSWEKPVDIYFRREAAGWRLVGLERLSDR